MRKIEIDWADGLVIIDGEPATPQWDTTALQKTSDKYMSGLDFQAEFASKLFKELYYCDLTHEEKIYMCGLIRKGISEPINV